MEPGDKQKLDQLIREQLPAGLRLAIRLTGDTVAAEDLLQDALLRVAGSWTSFREEASFRTWFTRIVINAFRDHLRAKQRRHESPPGEEQEAVDQRATPIQEAMANELGQFVARCVSSLPARQREVTVLLTYEGFTVAEAAELLGISEGNVHATHHQARQKLRVLLQPYLAKDRT